MNGQKEFQADSQQVLGSIVKVKAVDAAAEWSVEAETQMQSKKLQRKWLTWICPARHSLSPEEAIEPAPQQRPNHSQNEESPRAGKRNRDERATRTRASSKHSS